MTTVEANGVTLGVEDFGDAAARLVLCAGGTTMLSWPDTLCESLARGGRHVVRYDLRDSGASITVDPEAPAYTLRDLAADAAALARELDDRPAHLAGIGVGGMVAQVAALDHPEAFSALTLAGTRPIAPSPIDDDLPDHDAASMGQLFSRSTPDWSDRDAVTEYAAEGAEIFGNDPAATRAAAARTRDSPTGPNANCCDRLLEGVDERDPAGGADHRRRRVDLDHRQPPASLGNRVPSRVCALSLTRCVSICFCQVSPSTIVGVAVMLVSFDACQVTSRMRTTGPRSGPRDQGEAGKPPGRALPARSLTAGEPGPLGLVLGQRDRLTVGLTCFVVPAEPA